ncbi:MAG: aminotransferase class V-fold PLP-dependent enzyme [Flavobacteriaceae bacterium]|nr:aminotransferase class V-fold PLP-dependent enzyme [Flavobacteriaceae bacterium]
MKESLELFNEIVEALLKDEQSHPVAEFVPSNELYERLDLNLQDEAVTVDTLKEVLQDLVFKTPRTATNAFFNQLFGGRNDKAVLGDLLSVMLNNSMYTYKAAGPQVGVEKVILRKVCDMIGWDEHSNGTFASGGSMTNFMGMLMARDSKFANVPYDGARNKMTVYTSSESHYSVPKNAAFCGIGRDQVRYIDVDSEGKMNVEHLKSAIIEDISNGYSPVLVNATAGTTVLGAFDDINAISVVCMKYDIWLHVDGAYCGSVLFSKKYKHLIDGVEKVDSFSFNAHKMIGTPLTCSLLLVKDEKHLYDSFSNDASYLYQTDHDEFNLGKTSLQCGRRNDALKFWTLWKSVGTNGLEAIVDTQFELADVARNYIRNHPDYTLYSYDDSISVCFNYKDIPARELCTTLYENSELLVGYGSFENEEFVRLVTINSQNEKRDILNFFKVIEEFVENNENALIKRGSIAK